MCEVVQSAIFFMVNYIVNYDGEGNVRCVRQFPVYQAYPVYSLPGLIGTSRFLPVTAHKVVVSDDQTS